MGFQSLNVILRKIKINDIRTVNMLTNFKVKYFYANNSEFIPQVHKGMPYRNTQAHKGMPYRNTNSFDQVLKMKEGPFQ